MNRLAEILKTKRGEIERLQAQRDELRRAALQRNDVRSLAAALKRPDGNLAVLAEVKNASPSAGLIAENFNPVEIARAYEASGADAISVLTDEQFFRGSLDDLRAVRAQVRCPVLRKDFVLDEVQIMEAAAAGADAILLIVAALDGDQLGALYYAAGDYQLDAIVEVHTFPEMERALDIDAKIIGINNRDLGTFTVDLGVTEKLSEEVPNDTILISESGIRSAKDVARIRACGVDAVLVGEALMRGTTTIETLRPVARD